VILPPSASAWSADARQAALVHELTHIRRADRRTQALAQLACALYWFNPLVWYAAAALARERERACDDEVLRFGATPSAYATLLLDLARSQQAWMPATALSMARPSAIEGRLLAILGDTARSPRWSTRWIVAAMLAVVATTILGAQQAAPAPPAQAAAPKAPNLMKDSIDETARSITSSLVEALGDADGQVREQAAMGLALVPGGDVVEPLLKALTDSDAQVREKAAIGLSFRRDARIVEPLLTAIEDSDAQVREKAAIALGASGDDRAVSALQKAMRDPDSQVREKAVAGLVLLGLRK
jgi:HEAT repeat protein